MKLGYENQVELRYCEAYDNGWGLAAVKVMIIGGA